MQLPVTSAVFLGPFKTTSNCFISNLRVSQGKEKKKGNGNEKRRWKEYRLRKVGRTVARTDTQVIVYSVQCYALHLHWTDVDSR